MEACVFLLAGAFSGAGNLGPTAKLRHYERDESSASPVTPTRLRGAHQIENLTIGFTQKSAETFFNRLMASGAKRLVDVRLNNVVTASRVHKTRRPPLLCQRYLRNGVHSSA
jgi:hypothetical protein